MESIIQNLQELLAVPKFLINQIPIFPEFVKTAIIESLYFVPILYFLYFAIELLERFFMLHIKFLIKLFRSIGPFFGVFISAIPECGFQVIATTYYSRKLITRGTMMTFLVACSDEAYPLLFLDTTKTNVLLPLIIIKVIAGLLVWVIVDSMIIFMKKPTEEVNAVNIDLTETACCHHKLISSTDIPGWWSHPATHTFNIFVYVAIALSLYYSAVNSYGGSANVASLLMYNTPVQIVACAIFGLIPSCAASAFLAVAYVKGVISFAAFLAGLLTVTGVGLINLAKKSKKNLDTFFVMFILLVTGIVLGLIFSALPVPSIPIFEVK